jgi:hypothetical protein
MHDLTLLLPVVVLLFASPVFEKVEVYGDTFLLAALYAVLWASAHWWWLSPMWCVPVLIWMSWKFGRARCTSLLPVGGMQH